MLPGTKPEWMQLSGTSGAGNARRLAAAGRGCCHRRVSEVCHRACCAGLPDLTEDAGSWGLGYRLGGCPPDTPSCTPNVSGVGAHGRALREIQKKAETFDFSRVPAFAEPYKTVIWWRNTELNPRPLSEQKSVRKNRVPVLNHLAASADIGQCGWTARLVVFDMVTGRQPLTETPDRMAIAAGNAVALT